MSRLTFPLCAATAYAVGRTISGMEKIGLRVPVRMYLREWREHRGLKQPQLAGRMDCSVAKLSKLESGDQRMTDAWMAAAAYALGIEPEDLLHHPDQPTPNMLLRDATEEQREYAIKVLRAIVGNAA